MKASANQNILDLAVQNYGSIYDVFNIIDQNESIENIDHEFVADEEVVITGKASIEILVRYFKQNQIVAATGQRAFDGSDVSGDFNKDFNNDYL